VGVCQGRIGRLTGRDIVSLSMRPRTLPDDIVYPSAIAFVLVHLAGVAAIWTGVTAKSVVLAIVLYVVRMFAITAGFHRLFSHRSFKTSRWFQFVLGFVAESSAQSGLLWWAARHREHHKHSDTELDPHSPVEHGFFFSHVGWIFHKKTDRTDYSSIPDLTRCPELVWLDRNRYAPVLLLGLLCFLIDGWTGVVVGLCWSTVATWHGTFAINSLAHVHGSKRYVTGDESRNNWWLALITLGEGWHNNHHWYQGAARQGFRWWEIDLTFYSLKLLSWVGLVWDLKEPPPELVRGEKLLPRPLVEKAAARIAAAIHAEWPHPHLPSFELLKAKAEAMYAPIALRKTQSLDAIVARARALLAEKIADLEPAPLPEAAH
jgi:stearoyl-CoA desaturase (delta-9 desaturase)